MTGGIVNLGRLGINFIYDEEHMVYKGDNNGGLAL